MAMEAIDGVLGHTAARFEKAQKLLGVAGHRGTVLAPQPNVEEIAFTKTPSVTFEIVAEINLWNFRLDSTVARLLFSQLELEFLCSHHDLPRFASGFHKTSDRTEVSTRAHDQPGFDRIVNPPAVSGPFNRFHLFTQSQLGATTLQEVIIKFASTDSKAYYVLVANSDFFATKHAELET